MQGVAGSLTTKILSVFEQNLAKPWNIYSSKNFRLYGIPAITVQGNYCSHLLTTIEGEYFMLKIFHFATFVADDLAVYICMDNRVVNFCGLYLQQNYLATKISCFKVLFTPHTAQILQFPMVINYRMPSGTCRGISRGGHYYSCYTDTCDWSFGRLILFPLHAIKSGWSPPKTVITPCACAISPHLDI